MKILYVEDNPHDMELVRRYLKKATQQFDLDTANTIAQAIECLEVHSDYDLILTDINLPDGNGLNLIAHIREKDLNTAIVVISGLGDEDTAVAALKGGADDYITKNNDFLPTLGPVLEHTIDRHRAEIERHSSPLRVFYGESHSEDIEQTLHHFDQHAPFIKLHTSSSTSKIHSELMRPDAEEQYDVFLLDYLIPGLEVLDIVKELVQIHRSNIPIVLVTGQGNEDIAVQAIKFGAADYIIKSPGYLYKLPAALENAHNRAQLLQKQAALKESEAKYRTLVEQIPAAIYTAKFDHVLTLTYISPQILDFSGYSASEWLRSDVNWKNILHPDDYERVVDEIGTAIENNVSIKHEFRIIDSDNNIVWVRNEASRVNEAGERVKLYQGILLDITERKHSEKVQSILHQIARAAISSNSLDELFQLIHHYLSTIIPADNFYIALYDDKNNLLSFPYHIDQHDPRPAPHPLGRGLTEYVLRTNAPLFAPPEVYDELTQAEEVEQVGTDSIDWLGVPLSVGGKTIGVMAIQTYNEGVRYTAAELNILNFVSSQIALAIERKRAEDALVQSERRYRTLAEASYDMIFIVGRKGKVDYINKFTAQQFNLRPEDLIGQKIEDLLPIGNFITKSEDIAGILDDGRPLYIETPIKLLDRQAWLGTWLVPIFEESGQATSLMGVARDITERIETETALRASEERFSKVFHASSIATCITTLHDSIYIDANDAYLKLAGRTREEIENQKATNLNIWKTPKERDGFINRLTKERSLRNTEMVFTNSKGEQRTTLAFFELVELNRQDCIISMFHDITDRKEAEKALKESELSYRGLFNNVSDAIYIQDQDGTFVDLNEGAGLMSGYSREFLLGKTPADIAAPGMNDFKKINTYIQKAFHGKTQQFEFWGIRKNGEVFPEEVRLTKGVYFGQDVVFALAQDITNRKKAEAQLKRQLDELTILHAIAVSSAEAQTEDELIERVTDLIGENLYPDTFGILIFDEQNKTLRAHPSYRGITVENYPVEFSIETGLTGKVVSTGKPIRTDNPSELAEYIQVNTQTQSELCVPIKLGAKVLGVINAESTKKNFFSETDQQLLVTIAGQIAITMEKLRLFEAERIRRQEAETLRETSAAVTSTLDHKQAIELILEYLSRVIPYDSASVQILGDGYLEIVGGRGWQDPEKILGMHFPVPGDNPNTKVIQEKQYYIIGHAPEMHQPFREAPHKHIQSWLGVPLISHDKVIGMLAIDSIKPNYFTEENARLATAFANQVAVALENAQLFTETRQRLGELEAINRISTVLRSGQTLDQMLPTLLDETIALLSLGAGSIWLYEAETDEIVQTAAYGYPAELPHRRLKPWEGIVGHSFTSNETYVFSEIENDPHISSGNQQYVPKNWNGICVPIRSTSKTIGVLFVSSPAPRTLDQDETGLLTTLAEMAGNAIYRAELFERTERQLRRLTALREIDIAISSSFDLDVTLNNLLKHTVAQLNLDAADVLVYNPNSQQLHCAASLGFRSPSSSKAKIRMGEGLAGKIAEKREFIHADDLANNPDFNRQELLSNEGFVSYVGIPLISKQEVKGVLEAYHRTPFTPNPNWADFMQTLAGQAAIAIDNAQLFQETQRRLAELEAVNKISIVLRSALTLEDMLPTLLDETLTLFELEAGAVWLYEKESDEIIQVAARGWPAKLSHTRQKSTEGVVGYAFSTAANHFVQDVKNDPHIYALNKEQIPDGWEAIYIPIQTTHEVIGTLFVSSQHPRKITKNQVELLTTIAEMAGNAIYRAELYGRAEHQIRRLTALRDVDAAIASSFDLRVTLNILLDHTVSQLNIDAADILLFNPNVQALSHIAGVGFRSPNISQFTINIGQGLAGKAILDRKPVYISELTDHSDYIRQRLLENDKFVSYYGIPLIGKGQVKGILEIFNRSWLSPKPDWLGFLQTLAGQAAIAIDNAQLFENLQRSNQELSLAYDTTLEGWGRALELRDKETQGHTSRVTELTMRLARRMGLSDEELTHVRRGVLLHDIGKMGVPDQILRKTGELSDKEWESMKKHPQYAYDLLYPIAYLRPSLDIPYCHHERWDGKGYPRGLKGKEIPLSARMFAVVDVWDALLSDRPYRKAWPREKTIDYIKSQVESRFDPYIVDVFLKMVEEEN